MIIKLLRKVMIVMNENLKINIYCDESCHLYNDKLDVMSLGAVYCYNSTSAKIKKYIRKLKEKYNFNKEIKWAHVSYKYIDMYKEIINKFVNSTYLFVRIVVIKNKQAYKFKSSSEYDEFYYKSYYQLLIRILDNDCYYRIFLDRKDANGKNKQKNLRRILCNARYDFNREYIEEIVEVDSQCNSLVQLADFFTGMVTYYHRGLHEKENADRCKKELVELLISKVDISKTTALSKKSFNIFLWEGSKNASN